MRSFVLEMPAWAFFLDYVVYPPVILILLYLGFEDAGLGQIMAGCAMVLAGVMTWTLAEYLIHRFAFHHAPILKPIHMAHHDAPRGLSGTPTFVTLIVFYAMVYWPLKVLMGPDLASTGTAGLMLGYLAYVSVHYIVHHRGSGGVRMVRKLIRVHAVHHHDTNHNFGVTSDLWDRVFGTLARR